MADRFAQIIAASIREHPEEWEASSHRLTHKSGVAVWIANQASGLHVEGNGFRRYGVTAWCLIGGSPSQKHIWRAIGAGTEKRLADQFAASTPAEEASQ